MIQIIEEKRRPNRGQQLGAGIGGALSSLGGSYVEKLRGEEQSKAIQQENEQAKRLGINLEGIQDPRMRQEAFKLAMQGQNQSNLEQLRQQGKKDLMGEKQNFISQILGGNQNQGNQRGQGLQDQQVMPQNTQDMGQQGAAGFDVTQLTDEDISRATAMDPNLGRDLRHAKDVALREKREERNFATKEVSSSFKENEPFINKTYDQYEDSLRKEAITDRMDQLEESGQLSDSGVINLLQGLGLKQEWLKNPANEEYSKLGLDLLGGGSLQADYGSRVLASEFKVSMQRIPTLSQTPEGRKQIKENIRTMLLPSKLKHERLQFYLDQADRTGKPLPHNLRGKILNDIKPQLEEAYDKFKERNGRYQVKQGTYPDDNSLEKYYYLSEGNEEKAKKMMKEDGYNVGDANDRGLSGGSARVRSPSPRAGIY